MAVPAQLARGGASPARRSLRKIGVGYAFIAPSLALYLFFFIYPFVVSIYYSFLSWGNIGRPEFVGLANYARLIGDTILRQALWHNIIWVVVGTAAPIIIALLLGVLMWRGVRGMIFFRTIYFLPVVLAEVVVAIIWNWIYHPLFGALNQLLTAVGLGSLARGWLGDPQTALMALLVTAIWGYFGFAFVVIVAGLQDVNVDLVEVAMLDGANGWQRFIYVIIPELRPVLTMITTYTMIGGFNVFGIVFAMTQGGPGTATQVIGTYTYRKAFQENDIGYGAALSLVMTVITLVASYLFIGLREQGDA